MHPTSAGMHRLPDREHPESAQFLHIGHAHEPRYPVLVALGHVGLDDRWHYHLTFHTRSAELVAHREAEMVDVGFRGTVHINVRRRNVSGHGRNVDDDSPPALFHSGQDNPRHQCGSHDVYVDRGEDVFLRVQIEATHGRVESNVVYYDWKTIRPIIDTFVWNETYLATQYPTWKVLPESVCKCVDPW